MLTVVLHRAVMGMGPTLLGVLCCNVVSLSLAFKIKKNIFFMWWGWRSEGYIGVKLLLFCWRLLRPD